MLAVMSVAAAARGVVLDGAIPPVATLAPRTSKATATRENRREVIARPRDGFCRDTFCSDGFCSAGPDFGREGNSSDWDIQAYLSKRVVSARWANDAGRSHW